RRLPTGVGQAAIPGRDQNLAGGGVGVAGGVAGEDGVASGRRIRKRQLAGRGVDVDLTGRWRARGVVQDVAGPIGGLAPIRVYHPQAVHVVGALDRRVGQSVVGGRRRPDNLLIGNGRLVDERGRLDAPGDASEDADPVLG